MRRFFFPLLFLSLGIAAQAANQPQITKWRVHAWKDRRVWNAAFGPPVEYYSNQHRALSLSWRYQPEQSDDLLLVQTSKDGVKWKTIRTFRADATDPLRIGSCTIELLSKIHQVRIAAHNSWGETYSKPWIDPEVK